MSFTYDPIFGCRLSTARQDREGYAFCGTTRAHIAAWTRENGSVPEGKELDHVCRRRHCEAVYHLEPVDRSTNEFRKSWAYRSRIEKCPRGHLLARNVIVTPEMGRVCLKCIRENRPT